MSSPNDRLLKSGGLTQSYKSQHQSIVGSGGMARRTESLMRIAPLSNVAIIDQMTTSIKRQGNKINQDTESIIQEVKEATKSFVEANLTSSVQTIFAITNTMVGSVCLVVPQVFLKDGIFTCLITMVLLGLVQYKTCQLLIIHQRHDEVELEDTIMRILGNRMNVAFRVVSGTLLFIVGVVYFLLINSTLYPILEFIFIQANFTNYLKSGSHDIVFDQFSPQYLGIALIIPLGITLFIKDITRLIKLAEFGIVAIVSYSLFIVYIFISNLADGTVSDKIGDMNFFTLNFQKPAGQFALAFMIHNIVGPLIKTNRDKTKNSRDLGLAYLLAGVIYGSIGVFGAFGLLGKHHPDKISTILDFFDPENIQVLIIEILFLGHLLSVFPILNFVSRSQVLNALYPEQDYPEWMFYAYAFFHLAVCLIMQIFQIQPDVVIGFDGAVCGFFLIYVVPITLHMKCYYGKSKVSDDDENVSIQFYQQKVLKNPCVPHDRIDETSKTGRFVFYGIFFCVGLLNLGISIQSLFPS